MAISMFQKGDYLFSFDLKLGYHHVDIYEPIRSIRVLAVYYIISLNF